ncbi:MAG: hypothetical protein JJT85_12350 [Chromatiales bacterium]|nr:hypothetical protein [Chromatiales bacterium]
MVTYIATILAKPGHEAPVTQYYQSMEPMLREATGYRGRQILRAKTGTMAEEVRRQMSAEELARHPDVGHAKGTQFIMIEQWDSVADRVRFSRGQSKDRARELFPHIEAAHSHEFYEDVTPRG